MEVNETKVKIEEILGSLKNQEAVLNHSIEEETQNISDLENFLIGAEKRLELMKLAVTFLQELVDKVSKRNIEKINELANSALSFIFTDMEIGFQLNQTIRRNMNIYLIKIFKDGVEGNRDSFGGGVMSIVAFVLKAIFNIFSGRYPLLAFDESLSFLSDKYIANASKFINELSKEFNLLIILVTHQPLFSEFAHLRYQVKKNPGLPDSIIVKA